MVAGIDLTLPSHRRFQPAFFQTNRVWLPCGLELLHSDRSADAHRDWDYFKILLFFNPIPLRT